MCITPFGVNRLYVAWRGCGGNRWPRNLCWYLRRHSIWCLLSDAESGGPVTRDVRGRPVLTAAELDGMTPAERDAAFDASVVTAVEELPADYLAKLRADAEAVIARRDARKDVPHAS